MKAYLALVALAGVSATLAQDVAPPEPELGAAVLVPQAPARAAAAQASVARWLAPAFAAGIEGLRNAATERGVEPVPSAVREALRGYVPTDVLESARWRIDQASFVQSTALLLGDVPAMTLGDVIVFADADHAADLTLWAHEIFHVMQYREWGLNGFAERYLADYGAVELEAAEFRWAWMKTTDRVPKP